MTMHNIVHYRLLTKTRFTHKKNQKHFQRMVYVFLGNQKRTFRKQIQRLIRSFVFIIVPL